MTKTFCDICGDEIFSGGYMNYKEDPSKVMIEIFGSGDYCDSCIRSFNRFTDKSYLQCKIRDAED